MLMYIVVYKQLYMLIDEYECDTILYIYKGIDRQSWLGVCGYSGTHDMV